MADKKKKALQVVSANATPDKVVPKFASSVNFTVTNNRYVILSFIYSDPVIEGVSEHVQPTLIERILVDVGHAQTIVDKLQEVLSNAKKGKGKDESNNPSTSK